MKRISIAVAGLLTLQGQAGSAQPVLSAPPAPPMRPPEPPPPSNALVERFVAGLPRESWVPGPADSDPETLDLLVRRNPGKETRIALILDDFRKCSEPAVAAAKDRIYGIAALSPLLGAAKLERLADFFDGPDWPRFKAVVRRIEASPTPAAADLGERARLMSAYPIADLSGAMTLAAFAAIAEGSLTAVKRCEGERNAALAEAGIEPPPGSTPGP